MDKCTIVSGNSNKTGIFTLKEQGFFIGLRKNRPSNFAFKGGLFQNRYNNHKGQVKYSPYTQYTSVFKNPSKSLFIGVTAYWLNYYL